MSEETLPESARNLQKALEEAGDALRALRIRLEEFNRAREIKDVDVQAMSATDLMKGVRMIQRLRT